MLQSTSQTPVLLQTGFRIFFLGAIIYSLVSMIFWLVFYVLLGNIFVAMPLTVWHAHEMIFGYTMAVVAGFLLTAVMNWTGLPTLSGMPLLVLFLLWSMARVLAFMPSTFPIWPMAVCEIFFISFLSYAVIRPIAIVKQWKQSAVFSKLIMVLICSGVFYWALLHSDLVVERKALKFAVYMIVSLTLTIARRIMPFFIERGVGYPVTLRNSRFLDMASLVLILAFSIIDVFFNWPVVVSILSIGLVIVHSLRLTGWHTGGIWKKPLLWVLFLGYVFLILGFLLKVLAAFDHRFDDSALHAFTTGGIGVFTIGMMARVAWGHTGRNVAEPPNSLMYIFTLVVVSAIIRVFFTLGSGKVYGNWIGVSQLFWMLAFVLFLISYFKVLTTQRVDGQRG